MDSSYSLVFYAKLEKLKPLISGRLLLLKDGELLDTYIALSGAVGFQHKEAFDDVGKGCIPPNNIINEKKYEVATLPLDRRNVRGIDGNFYQIFPSLIKINGVTRGDFGIHRDANSPGSAGCIVLPTVPGWEGFQSAIAKLQKASISRIPLVVSYIQ